MNSKRLGGWGVGVWAWTGALLPLVVGVVIRCIDAPTADWLVRYYPTGEFSEQPLLTEHRRSARFTFNKWRQAPKGVGRRFGVRYQSCIVLRHPRSLVLQLVSSGSAQLTVQGRPLLQATAAGKDQNHAVGSVGQAVTLSKGVHLLEVEAVERRDGRFGVLASWAGELPQDIPSQWLVAPGADGSCPQR